MDADKRECTELSMKPLYCGGNRGERTEKRLTTVV
jgi:hypothetical protein